MKLKRKRIAPPSLSGVLATRRGALTLALLCAIAATGVLIFAIGKYRHAVSTGAKQDTVLVATSEIQKGTPASQIAAAHEYKVTPVLARQVSPGAIVNAAVLNGQVAASNILPGQQLTEADFTISSAGGGVPAELTPTERAISVSLDSAHGLTGVLQSGDQVDIYGDFDVVLNGPSSEAHQVVRLLIPDARVLKAPGPSGGGSSGANVVLAVQSDQIATLAYAADQGKVWLVLRPANASTPNEDLTTIDTILLGIRATAGGTLNSPKVIFKGTVSLAGGQ